MRLNKIILKAVILILPLMLVSAVTAQVFDEKSKTEAEELRNKVKALSGESERVKYLISYIEDKNSLVPEYAVGLLGVLKSKEVVPFLTGLLKNNDQRYNRVKEFIPQTLVNIKDKRSIEPLIEALGDKDLVVAKRSAVALTMLTKHNPGIKFDTFEQHREEAIKLWRDWWQKNKEVVEINENQKEKSSQTGKESKPEKSN